MTLYCIDVENVQNYWGYLLNKTIPGDKIILFFTEICRPMPLDFLANIIHHGIQLDAVSCDPGDEKHDNALDFQLCTELGALVHANAADEYVIVSEDKGFDAVVKYWGNKGIKISRFAVISTNPKKAQKNANKTKDIARYESRLKKTNIPKPKQDIIAEIMHRTMSMPANKRSHAFYNGIIMAFGRKEGHYLYDIVKPIFQGMNANGVD